MVHHESSPIGTIPDSESSVLTGSDGARGSAPETGSHGASARDAVAPESSNDGAPAPTKKGKKDKKSTKKAKKDAQRAKAKKDKAKKAKKKEAEAKKAKKGKGKKVAGKRAQKKTRSAAESAEVINGVSESLATEKTPGLEKTPELSREWRVAPADALRIPAGFVLADFDTASTPGWAGDQKDGEKLIARHANELSDLQERLFADGRTDGQRSVLLVLQGMDTSGKGGIVRHVVGLVDPQGVSHRAFGVPTPIERKHHYLWRIRRSLPRPGMIGVFDRSQYEDVLVVRVDSLVPQDVWERRYAEINRFERKLVETGTTVIKVALMISPEEQKARLTERLDRPDKHWKYNPNDVTARAKWPAYMEAYQAVFDLTNTDEAPWHVIPADNKWFARLAVSELLLRALRGLDLGWPVGDFEVAVEKERLAET